MRKIIALTTAAGLLVALAACSTSAPSGACEPLVSSGDSSSIITAPGSFGKEPKAAFPTPLVADGVQRSQISAGNGKTIFEGQYVLSQVSLYDGSTGQFLKSSNYESTGGLMIRAGEGAGKLGQALVCSTVGSRIAVSANGSDLYGFVGIGEKDLPATSSVVVVFDIEKSILGKAYGVDQVPQQGLPSVVTTPDGVPGVTVPSADPPTDLRVAVLKQADGATLVKGDTIFAHYLRVDWSDPKSAILTKSTWDDFGTPDPLVLSPLDPTTKVGLAPGLLKALIGQKVGSQILVVLPPTEGFPQGSVPDGVDATSTLVYVIDILGVAK